ncbi:hypothetical protein ACV334_36445, partial [Pseudomonas aeruginosa]
RNNFTIAPSIKKTTKRLAQFFVLARCKVLSAVILRTTSARFCAVQQNAGVPSSTLQVTLGHYQSAKTEHQRYSAEHLSLW